MLAKFSFDQSFWAEAASTAIYLINRSPNSTIDFKLPEEVWSGFKPDLGHLRTFGYSSYNHMFMWQKTTRGLELLREFLLDILWELRDTESGYHMKENIEQVEMWYLMKMSYTRTRLPRRKLVHKLLRISRWIVKKNLFSDDLIRGSSLSLESEDTPDQGGEESSSDSSNNSSDQKQDHKVENESGDAETLDTFWLVREKKAEFKTTISI